MFDAENERACSHCLGGDANHGFRPERSEVHPELVEGPE
jgi:hypothetical protein